MSATTSSASNSSDSPKRDFRKEVTDRLVQMVEEGVAPWQKPWEGLTMPTNPTTGKAYRGGNSIHLMARAVERRYEDPRWMTYRQAAEQGWQVRKGEKGTQIEFWDVKAATDDAPDEQEADRQRRLIHRVYTVFNARQIDGIPAYQLKRPTPFEAAQSGERILQNSGARIHHDQADRAFYNRLSDSIHLPPRDAFKDAPAYYGTALHELVHWTGHPSRLNRATLNESYRFGDNNYAKEELRAELASVFLAAERGIPHDPGQHAAYVASWITALKEDKNEIFRAAHDASKASDFLLALDREKSFDNSEDLDAAKALTSGVLGTSASIVRPLTDSGAYRGLIIGETVHLVVQQQSAHTAVVHEKRSLDLRPEVGHKHAIIYSNFRGSVKNMRDRTDHKDLSK